MANSKRLAIVGANASIIPLIEKAKELGYETHVFSWGHGDPGEAIADHFYPISISEKEQILAVCKEIGICGICSITSDYAFETVNYVARELGLVCNSKRTELVARNKYEMRKALRGCGAYEPWFVEATPAFDASEINSLPAIVKPTDRWSSMGVTKIEQLEQLDEAVRLACEESFNGNAIIEEFVEGPEYSAEFICQGGEAHLLAITEKRTSGAPHFVESAHHQPANLRPEQKADIEAVLKSALAHLSIENGAAHAEFRLTACGKLAIMEIGARMGGDCIGTHLTPLSTGYDYIRMVIDVACGNELVLEPQHQGRAVSVHFIMEKADLDEYRRIESECPDCIVEASDFDENFDTQMQSSLSRHGHYVKLD